MKNKYKKVTKFKTYLKKNVLNLSLIMILAVACNSVSAPLQSENTADKSTATITKVSQNEVATTYYKASVVKDSVYSTGQSDNGRILTAENINKSEVKLMQN